MRFHLWLVTAALAMAQPPIASPGFTVRNAATNSSIVAPGSLVSITPQASPLQPAIGATAELRFGTSDITRTLQFLPAPNSIGAWAQIPIDAPDGDLFVTLVRDGIRYTDRVTAQRTAPGVFTQSYSSSGPALAITYATATPSRLGLTAAAVPEKFVALFATGLSGARAADVTIDVAGQSVPAFFAGPQGAAGLDQINFVIPKFAYLGCYVPVTLRVRGVVSNTATLSINTDSGACAHPLGLSYSEMKTLDSGGSVPLANLSLSASQSNDTLLSEGATFLLTNANAATVALFAGMQAPDSGLLTCSATSPVVALGVLGGVFGDAGPITLLGPRGQEFDMTSPYFSVVPSLPSRFFTPGQWSISAPDGPVFFRFDQTFSLPPVIDSLNIPPFSTISGDQPFDILWNPDVFGPDDLVIVSSSGTTCTTRAAYGGITMPAPSRSLLTAIQVNVVPHPAGRTVFNLAMRDGRIMRAFVSYSFWLSVPVSVQ